VEFATSDSQKAMWGLRLCNNFIQLNKRTVAEPYIMTNTTELLNKVAGAKYLTRLDMTKAYWQLRMDPQSQRYTSFQTPFGTYKYLRMPMGLVNGRATLQRLMDHVLRGAHQYADKLLDDILVWSDANVFLYKQCRPLGETSEVPPWALRLCR